MNYRNRPAATIGHPFVAALCAGAVFVLAMAATGSSGEVGWPAFGASLMIAPIAAVFGFALAIVPCLIGSGALHALGAGNVGVRLPAFWAMIGGLAAGGGAAAMSAEPGITAAFATTGALSALICRSGARWP